MYKKIFKRLIDIIVSICILPIFAICYIIIAPIIYFQDKGKIFYNGERLGKDGKIFKMYKFKSEILFTISWIKVFIQNIFQVFRLLDKMKKSV